MAFTIPERQPQCRGCGLVCGSQIPWILCCDGIGTLAQGLLCSKIGIGVGTNLGGETNLVQGQIRPMPDWEERRRMNVIIED